MNAVDLRPELGLRQNLRALAREFGMGATVVAVLREALLGPGAARELAHLDRLSDHMRDDIGLPPRPPRAPSLAEMRGMRWPY
ncbi:MAG: hypothetical protein ACKVPY_14320 [Paracoccaceae bacterium]